MLTPQRTRHYIAYFVFFIPLLLINCSRLSFNEVSVVGRNFEDEVEQTQNLSFAFNKNVAPAGRLQEWDSTEYVRFKPAVRGKFKWVSENELIFSPAVAFDPATDYRAELTDKLLTHVTDKDLTLSGEEIAFHTPYLQLTGTESWWTRSRETGQPVAKLRLNFNYPVSAGEVAGKVNITAETDKALTTQAPTAVEGQAAVALTLPDAPASNNEQPLKLKIDKGIKVPNTGYTSQEVIEQGASLPNRQAVDVVDVQTGFDKKGAAGVQGFARVITTQELQPGRLSEYYTIQPAVETTAELTENGFIIRGDFNETDTYVLTLTDQIRGVLNTQLAEPVSRDLFFGKMPASIQFANKKAMYLSSKGARNVGLSIVNVPKVQVKIAKLYENNILHYLKGGRYEEYGETADGNWSPTGAYTYVNDEEGQYSSVLVNKTVETTDLPKVRGVSALNIAVPDGPGSTRERPMRGVYLISVGSADEAYLSASQLVSVSDIGLIARRTKTDVLVWAKSIRTAENLQGVSVSLISSNNQSVMTIKTDGDGLARFEKVDERAPGFTMAMVTASLEATNGESDFNFLSLADTEVETSRFEVEGKRDNTSGFEAFVYGDRNIYRPGETIHLNTVVRNARWESVGAIPLTLRVLLPNGREFRSLRKQTNSEGAVATDIPLDPAAVTGTYTVEVLNANNVLLTSESISVEEFIPDRIKVDVLTDRTVYRSGQTITVSATATNLFGPPAADRAYELELQLKRKAFVAKGFEDFGFTIGGMDALEKPEGASAGTIVKDLRQGRTNANGQATERFPVAATFADMGVLEGKLFSTVFDENGRPVNRLRRFDVFTQDVFFGVRAADTYVTTNAPLAFESVALDREGRLRPGAQSTVQIVRYDYQTVVEKNSNGVLQYRTSRREKPVYTNALTYNGGRASFRYVPTVSGEYEVRIRRAGATTTGYTLSKFYAYGFNSTTASSFEVSQEGQVLMTFDKATYETGDRAKVLFKCPFNGKLLVTIERNRVLEHRWLDITDKSAEWSFPLGNDHLPNVYVTATLIRAMESPDGVEANLPLTVAHGFAPVTVSDKSTQLPVEIAAVSGSRSKTKQIIRVKTKANAQVTIAVVDEGILQLKNFQTPNPHGFFYQKRALEVSSHDLYAQLFPELSLKSNRSSFGGDGYNLEKRVNPLANSRAKLVAQWSGILETGFDGEAQFTVDIPQFSGDLRVMAVAYKGEAFGSASHNLKVADPVVISAGVPRFLSPGDELNLPVTLSNTTGKAMPVSVRLAVNGPLDIVQDSASASASRLTLQPGREGRVMFRVRARQATGAGAIRVAVQNLTDGRSGETFTDQTDITIRPAASLVKRSQSGVVAGGSAQTIGGAATAYLPGTARTSLVLSRSPVLQYGRELSYLLGYPHGCLEQTISKAFPQLYFADLTRTIGQTANVYFVRNGDSDLNPAFNVRAAVERIEGSQLFNGGFGMWPGGTEAAKPDDWVTAYAVHFLTEADRAGYEVRGATLSKALDYLTALTSTPATEDEAVYDETGSYSVRKVASRTHMYALYALALAGKPNRPSMNYYKNSAVLTTDARYLLAAAFFRLGDTRSYGALLPKRFTDTSRGRLSGGSYASPIRNLALVLEALMATDRDNLQIPTLARQLSGAVRQASYLNTQESAFAFLALGKLARQNAGATVTATVSAGGRALGNFTGADLLLKRVPQSAVSIRTGGTGSLYYLLQSEGIPADGPTPDEDNGLTVRREYRDRNGNPVGSIRQNDLIVVKLTLASTNGLEVPNVVLTDLLPAGFEIENPRLVGEQRDMKWMEGAAKPDMPDHFDVRDDRINFYVTASGETKTYYYLVRAVTRGTFTVGAASADAMYNAELRSYSGAGKVRIE
ncbi:alpha-2-macroglobulin family protein [Rudanella lutea]|uniref:alpha-2-macroglobulin family protein n=1 Tax=Rudanella lutea TaxID=451374 RepID=UPI0003637D43|nr:alpha-2-macroglobulin [Rudanella lutea]